jgi:hypothetical protein
MCGTAGPFGATPRASAGPRPAPLSAWQRAGCAYRHAVPVIAAAVAGLTPAPGCRAGPLTNVGKHAAAWVLAGPDHSRWVASSHRRCTSRRCCWAAAARHDRTPLRPLPRRCARPAGAAEPPPRAAISAATATHYPGGPLVTNICTPGGSRKCRVQPGPGRPSRAMKSDRRLPEVFAHAAASRAHGSLAAVGGLWRPAAGNGMRRLGLPWDAAVMVVTRGRTVSSGNIDPG